MADVKYNRSIPEVLADAINQFTLLVRKETQLARTEMSEKLVDMAVGIGLLVGGAVLLIPALVMLLLDRRRARCDLGDAGRRSCRLCGGWGSAGPRHQQAAGGQAGADPHDRATATRRRGRQGTSEE